HANRRTANGPLVASTASPARQARARAAPVAINGQRAEGHSTDRKKLKPSATAAATPKSVHASWARRQGRTSKARCGNEPREPREVGFGRYSMAQEIVGQLGVRQVQKAGKCALIVA